MYRFPEENEADRALRRGLHDLPVPDPAPDFDARVRSALRHRTPWWQLLWEPVRPVLAMATCSCLVTLGFLHAYTGTPIGPPTTLPSKEPDAVASSKGRARIDVLDKQIENLDGSTPSLSTFPALKHPQKDTKVKSQPASQKPAPERRSEIDTLPRA